MNDYCKYVIEIKLNKVQYISLSLSLSLPLSLSLSLSLSLYTLYKLRSVLYILLFLFFFIDDIVQVKYVLNGFSLSHACFFFNSVKTHPMMHVMKLANECSS